MEIKPKRPPLKAKPQPGADVGEVIERVMERFPRTLRYLAEQEAKERIH